MIARASVEILSRLDTARAVYSLKNVEYSCIINRKVEATDSVVLRADKSI